MRGVTRLAPPVWHGEVGERDPVPQAVAHSWHYIFAIPCCVVKLMCKGYGKTAIISAKVFITSTGKKEVIFDDFEVLDTATRPQLYSQLIAELSTLKYSGGTTCDLRFDERLLPAGYKIEKSCIEQVTYFDMGNGYRLNVIKSSFGLRYSYIAVDITRTDRADAFAAAERVTLGRKPDLEGLKLLPGLDKLLVQMREVSRRVLFDTAS
ncbi:hypothetical protein J4E89_005934 [Alternaria sp. Ai002NY15]|nr:hypothetical protein J4E89_005934 [Alternaria sp. Ai002NY15]